jgi:predicted hydrocarbon binding protein
MISKFLLNLFAKGSIFIEDGCIYIWNNPMTFFPIAGYIELQKKIIEEYGEEGKNLIYWMGKIQGRVSSELIMNRFGFKPSETNFGYFVDGSSLVGMGNMKLDEYNLPKDGVITSNNSPVPIAYKSKYGKSKECLDHYMAGILAGGTEPLVNMKVDCIEEQCIGKGNDECRYRLIPSTKEEKLPKLLIEKNININELLDKQKTLFLKRNTLQKILSTNLIKYNNGEFNIKDNKGVIYSCYLLVIMHYIIPKEKIILIFENCIKENIKLLNLNIMDIKNIDRQKWIQLLNNLDIFGLGKFNIKTKIDNTIIIENKNNPFSILYKAFFGKQEKEVDIFSCLLLKYLFEKITDEKYNVVEKECIAKGANSCIFYVNHL